MTSESSPVFNRSSNSVSNATFPRTGDPPRRIILLNPARVLEPLEHFFLFFYHQPRNLRNSKKHEKTESKEIQYLDQFIASIDHVQFPPCCRRWSDSCRSIRKIENAKFDGTHFCSYVQSNDPKGYRFYFPLFKFKHFQNNLNIFCKNRN